MKFEFDKHRDIWGPLFTGQIQQWAEQVLRPADVLIEKGQMELAAWGNEPPAIQPLGGRSFSEKGIKLHKMKQLPPDYERVKYFDYAAAEYEMAVHIFKSFVTKHSFELISNYLKPGSRVMDCACGPGYEAIAFSMMAADSEVVAVDLSSEMIRLACHNGKDHGRTNMAFFQADAANLPASLGKKFDVVHCQLSCSYFEDLAAVAGNMHRALYDQGYVVLTEPFPNTANSASINFAKAANPYFNRLYSREDLKSVYLDAGFSDFYWKEILPGIGLSIISKL